MLLSPGKVSLGVSCFRGVRITIGHWEYMIFLTARPGDGGPGRGPVGDVARRLHHGLRGGSGMSVPAVRRIVVGVDGSADSVIALRWASREASIRGAEVHAVHVQEAPLHSPASYAVPAPDDDYPGDDAQMWQAVLPDVAASVRVRTETAGGLVARVLLGRGKGAAMLGLGAPGQTPRGGSSARPGTRALRRRRG